MSNRILKLLIMSLALTNLIFCQQNSGTKINGRISGKVFDSSTGKPVEYSNIILLAKKDSSQVSGTVTDKDGKFLLTGIKAGRYFFEDTICRIYFKKH